MVGVFVVLVLALLALLWIAAPLRGGARKLPPDRDHLIDQAAGRKRTALTGILDAEEERALGKLTEADFARLRADYEAEAVLALRELDALQASSADSDELELEIARVRAELTCPKCGAARSPGSVCPRCGG